MSLSNLISNECNYSNNRIDCKSANYQDTTDILQQTRSSINDILRRKGIEFANKSHQLIGFIGIIGYFVVIQNLLEIRIFFFGNLIDGITTIISSKLSHLSSQYTILISGFIVLRESILFSYINRHTILLNLLLNITSQLSLICRIHMIKHLNCRTDMRLIGHRILPLRGNTIVLVSNLLTIFSREFALYHIRIILLERDSSIVSIAVLIRADKYRFTSKEDFYISSAFRTFLRNFFSLIIFIFNFKNGSLIYRIIFFRFLFCNNIDVTHIVSLIEDHRGFQDALTGKTITTTSHIEVTNSSNYFTLIKGKAIFMKTIPDSLQRSVISSLYRHIICINQVTYFNTSIGNIIADRILLNNTVNIKSLRELIIVL